MLQIRKEHFPDQPIPEAPAPSPSAKVPSPQLPIRDEQMHPGKQSTPIPEKQPAAEPPKRRTHSVRPEQLSQLSDSAHTKFLRRVDTYLTANATESWVQIPPVARAETLRKASEEGAQHGFNEEIYRAQFIILSVMLGPAFFASEKAKAILDEPELSGPVKLFQLSHLGGVPPTQ